LRRIAVLHPANHGAHRQRESRRSASSGLPCAIRDRAPASGLLAITAMPRGPLPEALFLKRPDDESSGLSGISPVSESAIQEFQVDVRALGGANAIQRVLPCSRASCGASRRRVVQPIGIVVVASFVKDQRSTTSSSSCSAIRPPDAWRSCSRAGARTATRA